LQRVIQQNDGQTPCKNDETPCNSIIRPLQKILDHLPILIFFDSFRYSLAGEFSMDVDLARVIRIPGDWGGVRAACLQKFTGISLLEGLSGKYH
jgi:hypothetical protein